MQPPLLRCKIAVITQTNSVRWRTDGALEDKPKRIAPMEAADDCTAEARARAEDPA